VLLGGVKTISDKGELCKEMLSELSQGIIRFGSPAFRFVSSVEDKSKGNPPFSAATIIDVEVSAKQVNLFKNLIVWTPDYIIVEIFPLAIEL